MTLSAPPHGPNKAAVHSTLENLAPIGTQIWTIEHFGRGLWLVRQKNGDSAGEIAPEPTGHGLPLGKCGAYDRVYDQSCGSS
jgi:hypothetical protein